MTATPNGMNLMDSLLAVMQMERAFEVSALTQPFPKEDIKQRKGKFGKTLDYIEGHRVIQRLNGVTDNRWSNLVWWIQKNEGGSHVDSKGNISEYGPHWCALVTVLIPSMGARTQVGSKAVTGDEEDDIKAAITDGIKKAATLFGIALDLYEDSADAVRPTSSQPSNQRSQTTAATPPAKPTTQQRRTPASKDGDGRFLATQAQKDFILRLLNERLGMQGEAATVVVQQMTGVAPEELTKERASAYIEELLKTPAEG